MEQYVTSLIGRYRNAGVLVDTNLLLLYFVGICDRGQIERFRRTRDRFVAEDFETLMRVFKRFDTVVTTPHVLTEVSNLLGQLSGQTKTICFGLFAQHISLMNEKHTPAKDLSNSPTFVKFGMADLSIEYAAQGYLVLTDDFPLSGYLSSKGLDVLNFNNIRTLRY